MNLSPPTVFLFLIKKFCIFVTFFNGKFSVFVCAFHFIFFFHSVKLPFPQEIIQSWLYSTVLSFGTVMFIIVYINKEGYIFRESVDNIP